MLDAHQALKIRKCDSRTLKIILLSASLLYSTARTTNSNHVPTLQIFRPTEDLAQVKRLVSRALQFLAYVQTY